MKTERNILIAFILNLSFSLLEFFGGIFTGSVAIISDAIHDLGDALSIGISYYLERLSKKKPDKKHTYGYARYSVLGAALTSIILIVGSLFVFIRAIERLINPVSINYDGMLVFAIIGVIVNFVAAYFTKDGDSLNQKAVNLHMLEDVLGWVVVLIGSVIMKFTDLKFIDPLMSICLAGYIAYHAINHMKDIILIFAETADDTSKICDIERWIHYIDGVKSTHHLHIWRLDENKTCASIHVVTTKMEESIKKQIRHVFKNYGIEHVTIELESPEHKCQDVRCMLYKDMSCKSTCCHGHHHHHHHKHIEHKVPIILEQHEIEF